MSVKPKIWAEEAILSALAGKFSAFAQRGTKQKHVLIASRNEVTKKRLGRDSNPQSLPVT